MIKLIFQTVQSLLSACGGRQYTPLQFFPIPILDESAHFRLLAASAAHHWLSLKRWLYLEDFVKEVRIDLVFIVMDAIPSI